MFFTENDATTNAIAYCGLIRQHLFRVAIPTSRQNRAVSIFVFSKFFQKHTIIKIFCSLKDC